MKTLMFHDLSGCTCRRRMETREPQVQVLGHKPEREFEHVALHPIMQIADWDSATDALRATKAEYHQILFQNVRFSTMKWMEDNHNGEVSYGHYIRIDSYCCIPSDCNIDGAVEYEQGRDIYSYLNTVPMRNVSGARLSEKVQDLERKLETLSRKPILEREELEDMRRQYLDSRDHEASIPQPLKDYDYFENNLFDLERK